MQAAPRAPARTAWSGTRSRVPPRVCIDRTRMVFFQALASFIGRSAGKLLNAIFGWAVIGLFGRSSPRQQTVLAGLVAMAAALPLLLLGIVLPKIATFLLAFIPVSRAASAGLIRVIWIALAFLV